MIRDRMNEENENGCLIWDNDSQNMREEVQVPRGIWECD